MSDCSNAESTCGDKDKNPDPAAIQPPASAEKPSKAPSPRRCRDFIRREAAQAMPEIVRTFVTKAKDGSVPHFASLAKVGGFDRGSAASEAPKRRGRSFARRLLDDVEQYEANQAALAQASEAAPETEDGSNIARQQEQV